MKSKKQAGQEPGKRFFSAQNERSEARLVIFSGNPG
jgi:hypothetical protein